MNPGLARLQPYPFERLAGLRAGLVPNPALAPINLSIGEPRRAISREIGDDVLLRLDPDTGTIVGLTVLNLSTRGSLETLPLHIDLRESVLRFDHVV